MTIDSADTIIASKRVWLAPILVMLGIILLVSILDFKPIQEPVMSDASLFSILARVVAGETTHQAIDLKRGLGIWHPFMYQMFLILMAKTIGSDVIYARMFGFLCGLATSALIGWLMIIISPPKADVRWAIVIGVAFYLTNPFGRLGMLHLDIDNSVMPPFLLAATGYAILLARSPTICNTVVLILIQTLAFWTKLTTPLIIPVAMAVQAFVKRRRLKSLAAPLLIASAAGSLFILSWFLFCTLENLPPAVVFRRLAGMFAKNAQFWHNLPQVGRTVLALLFWLNPAFLCLAATCSWISQRPSSERSLRESLVLPITIAWGILISYIFIGGLTYTIPKYQYPAIPLFAVIIPSVLMDKMRMPAGAFRWITAIFLVSAGYFVAIGDPLYRLFYKYRVFLAENQMRSQLAWPLLPGLMGSLILVVLPLLLTVAGLRFVRAKERQPLLLACLLTLAFSYNISLGGRQAVANYSTTYSYGAHGAQAVVDQFRTNSTVLLYEGAILGPWNRKRVFFRELTSWNPREIRSQLEESDPDYFVVGLPLNTVKQMLDLDANVPLQNYLRTRFTERHLGDFIVYERWRP